VFSPHFLPPWKGGTPQVRDRVFILGTYVGAERALRENDVAPTLVRGPVDGWDVRDWRAEWILDDDDLIPGVERYRLSVEETRWIDVWDDLIQRIWVETGTRLPGFPLWADHWVSRRSLDEDWLQRLPPWKASHLKKNAQFFDDHRDVIQAWKRSNPSFQHFPATRRQLEWQAQDTQSLWDTVLHFRPSGIRAKAPTYLPALVAITQTSIIGSRRRRLTPHEAARLQGLPRSFQFSEQRDPASYKQVGNGVAVGAAWHVFRSHVTQNRADLSPRLVSSVLGSGENPLIDSVAAIAFDSRAAETTDLGVAG
jgi:DNA (cytosine-5)-methyltransferase 1